MKRILLFSLFLCLPVFSSVIYPADSAVNKLFLARVSSPVKIDGIIDSCWSMADSVSRFIQQQPFYGQPARFHTVAKVLSTDQALYCLIIAFDNSGKIQASSGVLDQSSGDVVSIYLDTYDDRRSAYRFAVNAAGVKADCRMIDDGRNTDYNWDGVWFAESKMYPWGYVVEMEIPFKSISYDKTLSEWGMDFDRWIPHATEDIYWSRYEENEGMRISRFGRLVLNGTRPSVKGMNLEVYPVALANAVRQANGKYKVEPDAGLDLFYNPSTSLTLQLTVNPDFAQIEADPYDFNITRYESYFSEKRPFFTQGNEIFMASGKERNSGFYSPLELFYSRRIGRKLPDGQEVPLLAGTKAFGRISDWEYGGFMAVTGAKEYSDNGTARRENRAYFGAARFKKQIFKNSTIGVLFVNKYTEKNNYAVLDIDGAIRQSDLQLAFQIARSFKNAEGGFAASTGLRFNNKKWILMARGRHVGSNFDITQIGYVPWIGTTNGTILTGPVRYFDKSPVKNIMIYAGGSFYDEKVDQYTDHAGVLGFNMQFRSNWGFEINSSFGRSKDNNKKYNSYDINFSTWFNTSPNWNANVWGGHERTYNFSRDYLASDEWLGGYVEWILSEKIRTGADMNLWAERKPSGAVEDITYNARPFINLVPVNNLNMRLYVDNVLLRSSDRLERVMIGFLMSYNFLPKSWIYFAYNEIQNRDELLDGQGRSIGSRMRITDRASVIKIRYLYYF